MKVRYLLLLSGCTILGACSKNNVEQASNDFNSLPPQVQQTVRSRVPNGEITDVNKVNRDGSVVYEIKFRDAERHPAITVAQNGSLVKYDIGTAQGGTAEQPARQRGSGSSSDLTALPLPVQEAIQQNAPKADVANITRTEQNGNIVYEVQYVGKSGNPTLVVQPDGKVTQPLQRTETR